MPQLPRTNFAFLQQHSEQLLRLGMLAEKYFADDPNTCLIKLRQLTELLAQLVATQTGLYTSTDEPQYDLLRRLQFEGYLPSQVALLFNEVRRTGNAATHALSEDHQSALSCLRTTWQLGVWFHRTFSDAEFKSGVFVPPAPPKDESAELRAELDRLTVALKEYQETHQQDESLLQTVQKALAQTADEKGFWEQIAVESEKARVELAKQLSDQQSATVAPTPQKTKQVLNRAQNAADKLELDEVETRKLIDDQLRRVGWEVDSANLTHSKGSRPAKGKNRAIAEWPTANGPADYVLFVGLMPIGIVEAKRRNTNVSATIQQAKRYSRGFTVPSDLIFPGGPWGEFNIPFTFSTNGRPFLRQLATHSGIWFCDVRRATNIARSLDGWYSPDGLSDLLKRDTVKADALLKTEQFQYGFALRDYQKWAIEATEAAVAKGERSLLIAMATGTGKTKTCIALIYRFLKVQRFRRVLFLVDRSALGEQAGNAFKETRMENLQSFADIFGVQHIDEATSAQDISVHIATVQSMVQGVLNAPFDSATLPVDEYDCIIVDECHRGYLLDRELSDDELTFRSYDDYISKYRRVLDYFDAVKIGLTATPALHTTEIFGLPVYFYSYREAVIDGYLIDHEPPFNITTKLSSEGIHFKAGEEIKSYDPTEQKINLFTVPDDLNLEVEHFNRKVITESFNEVVCQYLASEINPSGDAKTLIFCATDVHADLVVKLLKDAFAEQYGSVEDDAVMKITGKADKPLSLIRRYKNERNPNVAVTVDLLTTGIDVARISNLVFLRRVNSRILFDQMLGRATRLCPEIGKETFRIFDAVRIYEAISKITEMQPVVVDPKISFEQMEKEMKQVEDEASLALVRDQFLAKLQRKKQHLNENALYDVKTVAGMPLEELPGSLKALSPNDVQSWFIAHPGIGAVLDRRTGGGGSPVLISETIDEFYSVERGYGTAQKPDDYLNAFSAFIRENRDTIPALITVLTRPRDLTRKQLKELALALDTAGFTEVNLDTAWQQKTNQDIAARIVGYIRNAADGDPLIPYDQRVERAYQETLALKSWTQPQRQWLKKIAAQTKANVVVDREMFDDPLLLFMREAGGFNNINKIFNGELADVLDSFNAKVWE